MKNQTILAPVAKQAGAGRLSAWLNRQNQLFSSLLEETVSNRQVLLMLHALLAFTGLACLVSVHPLAGMVCLLWFAWSVILCKGGMKK